jgi:hypothetical protein
MCLQKVMILSLVFPLNTRMLPEINLQLQARRWTRQRQFQSSPLRLLKQSLLLMLRRSLSVELVAKMAGQSMLTADLQDLNATGNLAATQDLRPFIKGGATHLMHVTTAPGSTAYTHTYFSDISLTTRLLPDSIFDPQLDTNASESVAGSLAPWSDSSKTNWYESDFSVMTNSQTSGSAGSSNASISGGEGTAMWTNGSREGAVFCSGVSTSGGLDGHSNPKVQWGFRGKDGTQQTYGGATHVGTFCGSALGSGQCEPTQRMNLMWIR